MCVSEMLMQSSMAYYMLILVGIGGIFFELFNPGFILPGMMGLIAFCVGLYALHALPMYYLIILSVFLAIMLIAGVKLILRSLRRPVQNGTDMLMGTLGKTLGSVEPRGQALIQGEIWSVYSTHPIRSNCPIKVIAIKGICLEIEEQLNEGER